MDFVSHDDQQAGVGLHAQGSCSAISMEFFNISESKCAVFKRKLKRSMTNIFKYGTKGI